jgi:enoyl-CoA hydratase/carnithine racemase
MVMVGNLHKPPAQVAANKLVQLRVFEDGVAILEINDAECANSMDKPLAAQFGAAVDKVRAHSNVRTLIIQGNSDHFCTSIHLYSFVRAMQNKTVLDAAACVFQLYASFCEISSLEVPVLCVLHGKVVGSGFALALNTDWRVTASGTTFNYGNLPCGICPGLQLSCNLPAAVGGTRAMSLYLDNPTLSAAQLSDLGLLNAVAAKVPEARQLALRLVLASAAPSGVRETLVSMQQTVVDLDLLACEAVGMAQCLVEAVHACSCAVCVCVCVCMCVPMSACECVFGYSI